MKRALVLCGVAGVVGVGLAGYALAQDATASDAAAKAMADGWYSAVCSPWGKQQIDAVWSLVTTVGEVAGVSVGGIILGLVAWLRAKIKAHANTLAVLAQVAPAAAAGAAQAGFPLSPEARAAIDRAAAVAQQPAAPKGP